MILVPVLLALCISPISVGALYPTDTSDADVNRDLHGQNLQNTEYVKYDLSGADLSNADFTGSYFSVASVKNANLSGATLKGVIAYATRFDNADLTNVNFTGADLLKSVFTGATIDGADFTDAMLDRSQQKSLCERATGKTSESLQCASISSGYVPPIQK
tara:strand:- start:1002 stop:1481 length:480 start_codon:yes stop_codon:yes gene_type:complete